MSSAINKLVCSFKSDLPNEIDFAMQVATVLANSDNFIWSNDYLLVDAICSSLHVYSCVCQDASISSCYCYPRFWHKILDEKFRNLNYIRAATLPPDTEQSYMNFIELKDHETNDHNKIYKRIKTTAELIKQFSLTCGLKLSTTTAGGSEKIDNQQHLANGHSSTMQHQQQNHQQQLQTSMYHQQYQQHQHQQQSMQHSNNQTSQNPNQMQPMSTLHQQSVTNNVPTNNYTNSYNYSTLTKRKRLKASPSLLKFVSLLLVSKDMQLYLIGLDILSNTASKLSKLPESVAGDTDCSNLVQMFQQHCIKNICSPDGDIYIIIRSIEVVSRLISTSSSRVSSAIIRHINGSSLLTRIEQLLTSRNDVNLFLAALECCYRISRHQPHLIAAGRAQPMTKILVNLLNCEEKQFFTPSALKRIALIGDEESSGWTQLPPPKIIAQKTVDSKKIAQLNQSSTPAHKGNLNNKINNDINHSISTPKPAPTPATSQIMNHAPQTQLQPQLPNPNKLIPTKDTPITNGSIITNGLPNGSHEKPSQPMRQLQHQSQQQAQSLSQQQQPTQQPQIQSQPLQQQQPPPTNTPVKEYTCEWNNCNSKFTNPKQVYTHVFEVHIGSLSQNELSSCHWAGPNGTGPGCLTKRPKYSLLTHLNDFHCNTAAFERALARSDPIKPPVHPGYGPNAALLAIRRHANAEKNGSKAPTNSSPLSVSVRLTSALILRNLATQSTEMKQALGNHEPLLSEICMTNGRDESKIIAECLSLFSSE